MLEVFLCWTVEDSGRRLSPPTANLIVIPGQVLCPGRGGRLPTVTASASSNAPIRIWPDLSSETVGRESLGKLIATTISRNRLGEEDRSVSSACIHLLTYAKTSKHYNLSTHPILEHESVSSAKLVAACSCLTMTVLIDDQTKHSCKETGIAFSATMPPIMIDPTTVRRYRVPRSCQRCHSLKKRCDRKSPCASCVNARVEASCLYPLSHFIPRRPRNQVGLDVNLEVPEDASGQPDVGPNQVEASRGFNDMLDTSAAEDSATISTSSCSPDLLVDCSCAPRYVDDVMLSDIKKQVRTRTRDAPRIASGWPASCKILTSSQDPEIMKTRPTIQKSAQHTPVQRDNQQQSKPTFGWLLSSLPSSVPTSIFFPSKWQASKLWLIYLSNIDQLVKVLHVPSFEPIFYAAINDPEGEFAPGTDVQALLYAVFFAALNSVSDAVAGGIELTRKDALLRYRQGLELCIGQGSLLNTPTVSLLQALAIHLVSHGQLSKIKPPGCGGLGPG